MSLFGGDESKWLAGFTSKLYEEEYRYKKNIGEFAVHVKEDLLKWMLLVEDAAIVDMMYNDYSKGTAPEHTARKVIDYVKKQNNDMAAIMNNSLSAAIKIADTLTKRVEELEKQVQELKRTKLDSAIQG